MNPPKRPCLPLLKSMAEALALSKKEQDTFYVDTLYIQRWLARANKEAVAGAASLVAGGRGRSGSLPALNIRAEVENSANARLAAPALLSRLKNHLQRVR